MADPAKNVHISNRARETNTYDVIVVGSGISGGWAAKEFAEKGFKTLLLERGRNVEHVKDYPTASLNPWEFDHRLVNPEKEKTENPVQSTVYDESNKHFFVSDKDHPYIQNDPFHWIRGYQVGGRSLMWGRQCYRWSDLDFEANAKDGVGVDWPIRYKDIEPWYTYVERFVGISGSCEGLPHLPDGDFLPPMAMNALELRFKDEIKKKFPDRLVTIARLANLSRGWNGRGPCQYRNLCSRGCPFGGYFSSNSATIPVAMATGNLTLRPFSIVAEVLYDKENRQAKGVRVVDTETKESIEFFAKVIFLNASTIASAAILLQSKSDAFPEGMGNGSGQLGRNLMDHHFRIGAEAQYEGLMDQYYVGRRPGGIYIPRFRNVNEATKRKDYIRGFGIQADAERRSWYDTVKHTEGFGKDFKEQLISPGIWTMWMGAWGETLPYEENKVTLDENKTDKWGIPLVKIDFSFRDNEKAMRKDMKESAMEMLHEAGLKNVTGFDYSSVGGDCVHEMGTARMGHDPKTSVLNKWNQLHEVKNVFITDGSCMTSSACQNPSLTYMALTARACDFAVSEMKKGSLG
ncbi:GMC oxidoreductase [Parasegetibacter sp. NRK P23]|uniref:GMC oxidoreductase n=1 Tax=Parasegetibacter sp. NRK P23 TaxID=2942999 RepID=UPI0020440526|nr:GMC family oxidoreductase [Parasegetibacter sp. NRK P23]MCM5529385.1 GMC family oxidoreductase [Parasegetibacter sp. NRK P23]